MTLKMPHNLIHVYFPSVICHHICIKRDIFQTSLPFVQLKDFAHHFSPSLDSILVLSAGQFLIILLDPFLPDNVIAGSSKLSSMRRLNHLVLEGKNHTLFAILLPAPCSFLVHSLHLLYSHDTLAGGHTNTTDQQHFSRQQIFMFQELCMENMAVNKSNRAFGLQEHCL